MSCERVHLRDLWPRKYYPKARYHLYKEGLMSDNAVRVTTEALRGWRHWVLGLEEMSATPTLIGAYGYPWIPLDDTDYFEALCLWWGAVSRHRQGSLLSVIPSLISSKNSNQVVVPPIPTWVAPDPPTKDHREDGKLVIPHVDCSCGFYVRRPEDKASRWRTNFPLSALCVEGEVELFGRIFVGTQGYRAQRARILGPLYLESRCTGTWVGGTGRYRDEYMCPLPAQETVKVMYVYSETFVHQLCEVHGEFLSYLEQQDLEAVKNLSYLTYRTSSSTSYLHIQEALGRRQEEFHEFQAELMANKEETTVYPAIPKYFFGLTKPLDVGTLTSRDLAEKLGGQYKVPVIRVGYEQLLKTGRLRVDRLLNYVRKR